MTYLFVGLGGALGAVLRYLASRILDERAGTFPMGTWAVNISGAFFLGLFLGLAAHGWIPERELQLALTTGFLGAYTTFSTFSYEVIRLFEDGESFRALGYMLSSIMLGLAAAWLGIALSIHLVS